MYAPIAARAWSSVSNSPRQMQRSLSFETPGLDERLALGVAVAAAAVRDAKPGEHAPEAPGSERRAVVGAEREHSRVDALLGEGRFDDSDCLLGSATELEAPPDDLAGAAVDDRVQIAPAVLGDPDRRHVHVPQPRGPLDAEDGSR